MARRNYKETGIILKSNTDIINIIKSITKSTTKTFKTLTLTEIKSFIIKHTPFSPYPLPLPISGGIVAGRLRFRENESYIVDCSTGSTGSYIDKLYDIYSDALFILLVDKSECRFKLSQDRFWDRFPCIVIETKHDDVANCVFLWKINSELKLPVFALMNWDPNSLKKLSLYKMVTDVKWLGIKHSDLDKFKLNKNCPMRMSDEDIETCEGLLEDKEFVRNNPGFVDDLQLMLKLKKKLEIDALSNLNVRCLTELYVPSKLQELDLL